MRTYGWAFLATCIASACGGQHTAFGECEEGAEGCGCYPNGTCNDSLSCFSSLCVDPSDSQSGGGSGHGNAGGAGNTTGGAGNGGEGGTGNSGEGGKGETGGNGGEGGSAGNGGSGGNPNLDCSEAAKQVYLVDSGYQFIRFEPSTMTFTILGRLGCPTSGTPNSMAMDRDGRAWVNYTNGELFHVDIQTLECQATGYVANQQGFGTLGMGFASDAAGSEDDTLYVTDEGRFGMIDTGTLALKSLGALTGKPEFTGNALGELWGFAPPGDAAGGTVQQIDKSDGSPLSNFDLSLPAPDIFAGGTAWAFAFWGGDFYIFYQGPNPTTDVYIFNPSTGQANLDRNLPNLRIVGAGVSTCAPTH